LLPARDTDFVKPGLGNGQSKMQGGYKRKTRYTLVLVDYEGILVSIDSRVPNELVYDGLKKKFFSRFHEYNHIKREAGFGNSRLDFQLSKSAFVPANSGSGGKGKAVNIPDCLVEVKSVSLVHNNKALFPDAPTVRGARHMKELKNAVSSGFRADVIFIIQRGDAESFAPNFAMDPDFSGALREASENGVNISAYTCQVTEKLISIRQEVPIIL